MIINWLKSNKAFVVTLTLYGDPAFHIEVFKESSNYTIAPFQQWIFGDADKARRAAQSICEAIIEKAKESDSTITINPLEEVAKGSQDIVLCLELNDDHDDTTQYRLYVTAYQQKSFGEWI